MSNAFSIRVTGMAVRVFPGRMLASCRVIAPFLDQAPAHNFGETTVTCQIKADAVDALASWAPREIKLIDL